MSIPEIGQIFISQKTPEKFTMVHILTKMPEHVHTDPKNSLRELQFTDCDPRNGYKTEKHSQSERKHKTFFLVFNNKGGVITRDFILDGQGEPAQKHWTS